MGGATPPRERAGSATDADEHATELLARPRHPTVAVWVGAAALAVVALGIAWVVVTGLLARAQLQQLRSELPRLRQAVLDNRMGDARALSAQIRERAARARALTSGPAWWIAANLPVLGEPLETARVMTSAADRMGAGVVPTVVSLAGEVSAAHGRASTVDLRGIRRLAPELRHAARVTHEITSQVMSTSGSWLGPVSKARASLLGQLTDVDGELTGADRAVRVAIPMLGGDGTGPRRYFIGFLNEAEARGLGGIPGAFAIAVVEDGHVRLEHFGSDTELTKVRAPVDLGREYEAIYGQADPAGTFPNSDISPDFRDAAQIWAGMWRAKTGEHVDGALALDPTALSYLLRVIGPATLADGSKVNADNVVALTQQRQYSLFPRNTPADNAARKRYLIGLAEAISARLTGPGRPHQLVRAVSRAAQERRFVVWSARPDLEREIVRAGWGGSVGAPPGTPHSGFVVNNAAGGKLDFYLDRSMTYRRTSCDASAVATATFAVTNRAPTSGLPPYVTIRADGPPARSRPGDNRLLITYFGTAGARVLSVTLDGKPATAVTSPLNGMPTATLDVEVPAGTTRTVQVRIQQPPARQPLQVLRQPLVRSMKVAIDGPSCN